MTVREADKDAVIVVTGKGNDPFMLGNGMREPYECDSIQFQRTLADWDAAH